jgi:hypothetical protein
MYKSVKKGTHHDGLETPWPCRSFPRKFICINCHLVERYIGFYHFSPHNKLPDDDWSKSEVMVLDRSNAPIRLGDLHSQAVAAFIAFKEDPNSDNSMMGHCGDRKNPFSYVHTHFRTRTLYMKFLKKRIRAEARAGAGAGAGAGASG